MKLSMGSTQNPYAAFGGAGKAAGAMPTAGQLGAGGGMNPMAMSMIMSMLSGDKKQEGPAPLINEAYNPLSQGVQQFYNPYIRAMKGA